MQRKILTYLCCVIMLFAGVSAFANKKGPPTPPKNKNNDTTPPPPPVGLPIDSGLSLLLIAGTAYGVYAIKKIKRLKI